MYNIFLNIVKNIYDNILIIDNLSINKYILNI